MIDLSGISEKEWKFIDKQMKLLKKSNAGDIKSGIQIIADHVKAAEDIHAATYVFSELVHILKEHKDEACQTQLIQVLEEWKEQLIQQIALCEEWELYQYFYDAVYVFYECCKYSLAQQYAVRQIPIANKQWMGKVIENAIEYANYLLEHYRRNQAAFWMNQALAQQKFLTGECSLEVAAICEKFKPIYILEEHDELQIEVCEKRVEIYEKLASHPIGLADAYADLACAYHVLWDTDSEITYHTSLDYVDKAVELYNQVLGEGNEKALKARKVIARVLTFEKSTAPMGIEVLKKELEREKMTANPNLLTIRDLNSTISQAYADQLKDVKAAIPYSLEEVEYTCRYYGEESDMAANSYSELAELYERAKDYANAAIYYEKALEINIQEMGKVYLLPKVFKNVAYQVRKLTEEDKKSGDLMPKAMCAVDSLNDIGRLHCRSKDYKKAITSHKKALALLQWLFEAEDMEIFAEVRYNLGKDYHGAKDYKKAADEYHMALQIYEEILRMEYSDDSKNSLRQGKRIVKLMDKIQKDLSKTEMMQ